MYDRILVPIDGGEHATAALEHALELATVHGATVHALYVIDTTTSLLTVSKDEVRDALRTVGEDAAAEAFTEAEAMAGDYDVAFETEVREGKPDDVILDEIAASDPDVLVMGTHGREGVSRRLLGSVAERVVREAPVPVLTVHAEDG
jgi:nucleotide-binding universal stress UspA family protein